MIGTIGGIAGAITAAVPSGSARKPVLLMALGAFALGTDAFVISGVLPSLGRDLGVGVATAGLLITVFAGVYALAAPFLAVGTGHLDRRRVLLLALGGFVAANVLAAAAPNYAVLMAARVVAALSAGLYMPAAAAAAAALSSSSERGRALTTVLGGLTLASALGVPLGTMIGEASVWRATFVFVSLLSLGALLGLYRALPAIEAPTVVSLRDRARAAVLPGVPLTLLVTGLTFCNMFTLYAYLAWFAGHTAGIDGASVTWVYLAYGVCGVISNLTTGWLLDRFTAGRVASLATIMIVPILGLISLFAWLSSPGTAAMVWLFVLVGVWGLVSWAINPSQQARLLDVAGPHAPVALSLNGSAVYGGQAIGSLVGAAALIHGTTTLALTALAVSMLTLGAMGASLRRSRPSPWRQDDIAAIDTTSIVTGRHTLSPAPSGTAPRSAARMPATTQAGARDHRRD